MSNLYGSDAARSRCVATRKTVGDAVRSRVAAIDWLELEPAMGWDFLAAEGTQPAVGSLEPDLDTEEISADK